MTTMAIMPLMSIISISVILPVVLTPITIMAMEMRRPVNHCWRRSVIDAR